MNSYGARDDRQEGGLACSGIGSMATRRLMDEATALYMHQTGQSVAMLSVGGVHALQRLDSGEAFDFAVLAADSLEDLVRKGLLVPGSRVDVARSSIALAVAAGAPRPRIDNESDVREAVRRASTVGYSTGPSGVHLLSLMKGWGLSGSSAPRLVQAPPGIPVGTLIARGDAELGFQQLGELMHEPGVDVVGLLPAGAQAVTVFAAAVCTATDRAACASQFLAFLASPQMAEIKLRLGLESA